MIRYAVAGVVVLAFAQAAPADRVRTQSMGVSDNLYLMSGGGGNSLMMTADSGVILVDTKAAGQGRTISEVASGISDQPITTAIYTHAHLDHTAGSKDIPTLRRIIAHENTKTNMARMDAFAGPSARFLPDTTFADRMTIGEGIDRADLYYFGAAHTNGDIVVVFPGKRAAYLGDLFPGKMVPVIDGANGGSGLAWPQTLAKAIPALQGIGRIIPGHAVPPPGSPLGRWVTPADLQEYASFTRDLVAAVQDAFKSGKTPDEAAASLTLRDRYPAYNFDGLTAAVRAIYADLK
jgi:glyoxylase-like metal-dependent hydrolase (beta-lactamase superfamily II)